MVSDAFPNSVKDAPEVVRQTKRADVLVVDFSSASSEASERLGIGAVQHDLRRRRRVLKTCRSVVGRS